jgi:hypothetical protein
MSRTSVLLAPLLAATAWSAAVGWVPTAGADPFGPVSASQPADVVIHDLQAQGYNVQINWVTGFDTKPLSECRVTGVNDPGDTPPTPGTFTTVYVDVACPNGDDDGFDFDFGFGAGIG